MDWDEVGEQMRAVADSGDEAWPALLEMLQPELLRIARRQPIGRLRDVEDTPHEIVTRVFGRLHARDFAAIRKLVALDEPPPLRAWFRVLVKRCAIDYLREQPEFERRGADGPGWYSLITLTTGAGAANADTLSEKRREVLRFVREAAARARAGLEAEGEDAFNKIALEWGVARLHVRRLAKKGDRFVAVLESVLQGRSYPETAEALGLSRREVELSIRYVEELLNARNFARLVSGEG